MTNTTPNQIPESLDELAQTLAHAHASGAVVVPEGGGTRRALGGQLRAEGREVVVVNTRKLNHILQHEPTDLTISVEAGITMAELDAHLAQHGQMLPVDVALPARSTLGGALATDADGPRSARYGRWRDLLIGVRVVEHTGRISKAGGMVVKNVSGFDMMKLYIGSLGSLAVIGAANFKLLPRSRHAATIRCACPTVEAAWAIVEAIRRSPLQPAAVELVGVWGFGINRSPVTLAVLAEGHPAAVERHVRDVERMAREAGAAAETIAGDEHRRAWARTADIIQTDALEAREAVLRVATLPAALPAALAGAAQLAQAHDMALMCDARALAGVAYLRVRGAALPPFLAALRAGVPAGGVTVMGANPPLASSTDVWGESPETIALMRRIKSEFDPMNMLNPGRFIV